MLRRARQECVQAALTLLALGCSTGRYPALSARSVDGGVSSIASSIAPSAFAIARHRPLQRPALHDQKTLLARLHHRAVGQLLHRHRQRMQPLLAALQPLAMQHGVDLARANVRNAIALLPRRAKPVGIVTAAEEAGPMTGGERGRLVEKEQLGPAPPAHHLAPPAPEFADTGDPGRARPALLQQASWSRDRG